MDFKQKQSGVRNNIAAGAALMVLITAFCIMKQPLSVPDHDRVGLWMKWNLPKAACVWWYIARVGTYRFVSPVDIDAAASSAPPSPHLRMLQSILQNTLEQAVVAALVHGAFAVLAPTSWLLLIPVYTASFVAGRVCFAAGYGHGAPYRALGMVLTYMPTTAMMLACFYWMLMGV